MWLERRWFTAVLACMALATGLASCTKGTEAPGDPKSRLSEYISTSFAVKGPDDKQKLMSYLTGDARARLEAWSDEQFTQAFTNAKRQFLKLAIRENKPLGPAQVNITYEVTYLDESKGKGHHSKVTTKKLAELTQVEGRWLISEVRNIKEMIEYQDEISFFP